jgi:pyruvate,water dikinase
MISSLTSAGIRVPGGFATTAKAFDMFMDEHNLADQIKDRLARISLLDIDALSHAGSEIRELIISKPLPAKLEQEIREAYDRLCKADPACADIEASFAVRSSATAEDLADASFAGQQDTVCQYFFVFIIPIQMPQILFFNKCLTTLPSLQKSSI